MANIPVDDRAAAAPIDTGARMRSLDALRGVALLGIVLANVRQIFLPWDIANFPAPSAGAEWLAWVDWQLFHALVDLKFLTIFSLLFGIGFALQGERLTARGEGFAGMYLRRVLILALLGIAHGLLLYPAEVLLPYSIAALLLLALNGLSADNLLRVGLVLLGSTLIWGYQIGSLGSIHVGATAFTIVLLTAALYALWRRNWRIALAAWVAIVLAAAGALTLLSDAGATGIASEYHHARQQLAAMASGDSASSPKEFLVRQDGSFAALVRLHASQYADILLYFAVMLLWRTLGLFMIGAGLLRSGALHNLSPVMWRRVAAVGSSVGVTLSVLATWLHTRELRGEIDWRFPDFLHAFSALPLAAGIAGGVFVAFRSGSHRWLWSRIEAAGRMALTNYVGQSLVLAALAEAWGLGLYGQLGAPALTLLALLVFAALATLSHTWLARYRMGPLEWLWRCGTYWRWLRNRPISCDDRAAAPAGTEAPSGTRTPR